MPLLPVLPGWLLLRSHVPLEILAEAGKCRSEPLGRGWRLLLGIPWMLILALEMQVLVLKMCWIPLLLQRRMKVRWYWIWIRVEV